MIVTETEQKRGILGVVDARDVESADDVKACQNFHPQIGYKL
ncbi:MAG: adenosine-specific kinase [Hassallia sp.]